MHKKKILVILRSKDIKKTHKITWDNRPILTWINDCKEDYDFDYWGKYFSDITLSDLNNKIDEFKPDFIYLTQRVRYEGWLPDLTSIKNVPKIYVEVDNQCWDVNDPWYGQFDQLYCREPSFNGWNKIPLFRWSVPEIAFPTENIERKGVYFIGKINPPQVYGARKQLRQILCGRVKFIKKFGIAYWYLMKRVSALLCPTESSYGNFIPSKLFEFLASGAAVITNCDFNQAGIPELEEFSLKYSSIRTLKHRLNRDFTKYHNKAIEAMRNHTHRVRYKELFK